MGTCLNAPHAILRLCDHESVLEQAAAWFHQKWGIPQESYAASMTESLRKLSPVPQWYIVTFRDRIIAGAGVIENDFHNRKDLTPNICALYVEEAFRNQGIAGMLLHFICEEFSRQGVRTLYLVTDHVSFYERHGWEFVCMVQTDGEEEELRMYSRRCDKPTRQV